MRGFSVSPNPALPLGPNLWGLTEDVAMYFMQSFFKCNDAFVAVSLFSRLDRLLGVRAVCVDGLCDDNVLTTHALIPLTTGVY
jgi:hypothetical protein